MTANDPRAQIHEPGNPHGGHCRCVHCMGNRLCGPIPHRLAPATAAMLRERLKAATEKALAAQPPDTDDDVCPKCGHPWEDEKYHVYYDDYQRTDDCYDAEIATLTTCLDDIAALARGYAGFKTPANLKGLIDAMAELAHNRKPMRAQAKLIPEAGK